MLESGTLNRHINSLWSRLRHTNVYVNMILVSA